MRLVAVVCGVVLTLAACTGEGDPNARGDGPQPTSSQPAGGRVQSLPCCCDELVSGLDVARALQTNLAGGRSYTYLGPGRQSKRTGGLICEHGVRGSAAAVRVILLGYSNATAARRHANGVASAASAQGQTVDRTTVAGERARLISGDPPSYLVRDGRRVFQVELQEGASAQVPTLNALRRLSAAVVASGGGTNGAG